MTFRVCRAIGALIVVLATSACAEPSPPAVAVRAPALDVDDLAVLGGALDHLRGRRPGVSFLVVDTTIALCRSALEVVANPPGGCLAPGAIDAVAKVLPLKSRVTAMLDFTERNARRLPLAGGLGGGVTYVSATLTDFVSSRGELPLREIVTFSAPSYPAPRVAVLWYGVKDAQHGAIRLEQRADGGWIAGDWSLGVE